MYPTFNIEKWVFPKNRFVHAASPTKIAAWEMEIKMLDARVAELQREHASWSRKNGERGKVIFHDTFDGSLANWSNTASGAVAKDGALRIVESGTTGDRALSTRRKLDWTPDKKGAWIQATFGLVADRVKGSTPAARIGWFIALHDFNDRTGARGGNLLLDGNPAGGAVAHLNYPGGDSKGIGTLGAAKYRPGHSFGARVTNAGDGKFRLEHFVDGVPEGKSLTLAAADLHDGGFGFEYCCGRSFVVDNVTVETNDQSLTAGARKAISDKLKKRRAELDAAIKAVNAKRTPRPGKIAWVDFCQMLISSNAFLYVE